LDEQKYPLAGDRWYRIRLAENDLAETLTWILKLEIGEGKAPLPGLKPEHFEYEFGSREKKDYLGLQTEDGTVLLRGKIDRVDVDPSGKFALVIDYKTGKTFNSKKLKNATQLQLLIYLLAVQRNLGLRPLGGHLYALRSGKSSGIHHRENLKEAAISTRKHNQFERAEWDALFADLSVWVARYVRGIRQADIPVRPRDCVAFCSYANLCRIEKWRLDYIYREIEEADRAERKEEPSCLKNA
jgi:hypothetical protein